MATAADVAAPSWLEQSVDVGGRPSQLVRTRRELEGVRGFRIACVSDRLAAGNARSIALAQQAHGREWCNSIRPTAERLVAKGPARCGVRQKAVAWPNLARRFGVDGPDQRAWHLAVAEITVPPLLGPGAPRVRLTRRNAAHGRPTTRLHADLNQRSPPEPPRPCRPRHLGHLATCRLRPKCIRGVSHAGALAALVEMHR